MTTTLNELVKWLREEQGKHQNKCQKAADRLECMDTQGRMLISELKSEIKLLTIDRDGYKETANILAKQAERIQPLIKVLELYQQVRKTNFSFENGAKAERAAWRGVDRKLKQALDEWRRG